MNIINLPGMSVNLPITYNPQTIFPNCGINGDAREMVLDRIELEFNANGVSHYLTLNEARKITTGVVTPTGGLCVGDCEWHCDTLDINDATEAYVNVWYDSARELDKELMLDIFTKIGFVKIMIDKTEIVGFFDTSISSDSTLCTALTTCIKEKFNPGRIIVTIHAEDNIGVDPWDSRAKGDYIGEEFRKQFISCMDMKNHNINLNHFDRHLVIEVAHDVDDEIRYRKDRFRIDANRSYFSIDITVATETMLTVTKKFIQYLCLQYGSDNLRFDIVRDIDLGGCEDLTFPFELEPKYRGRVYGYCGYCVEANDSMTVLRPKSDNAENIVRGVNYVMLYEQIEKIILYIGNVYYFDGGISLEIKNKINLSNQ